MPKSLLFQFTVFTPTFLNGFCFSYFAQISGCHFNEKTEATGVTGSEEGKFRELKASTSLSIASKKMLLTMVKLPAMSSFQYDVVKVTEQSHVTVQSVNEGPWKNGQSLKPCWNKPSLKEGKQSKGFITFSLTHGPEYHVSQIANALVIARYLGATLVLPDIKGSEPGDKRKFGEIYNVEEFVSSLDGVVEIARDQPAEISTGKLVLVKVPNRVSEDHIAVNIEPIFRKNGSLRLSTFFPSIKMRKTDKPMHLDSFACLAMFGALRLQPGLQELIDSMIVRLRTLSQKSNGQFIAVDLRVEKQEMKECQGSAVIGRKSCYHAEEVGEFLRKIGFEKDTTIYLTHRGWHNSFDALREIFPKTYTKEDIMSEDKKAKFLYSGSPQFQKVIDFYICSRSDFFVPAISGLFYANVAGMRIASGKTQILVPAPITSSTASASNYISPYIYKKNHLAYSCFC